MDEIEIYATTIVAILGIAYPLVLQVISKLDDTYGSTRIIELFESEGVRKWFPYQLYASLISVFLWSLKLEPLYRFEGNLGYVIDNSGTLLVIVNSILLVVAFILLVNKIFVYSTTSSIARYLIKKHDKRH